MDLKACLCPGMFLDMQSWCLSSVTAFCVCARSFQEGQVEVSPKSLIPERVCERVLDFWARVWLGSWNSLSCWVWAVLESLQLLFLAASFGTCMELGNGNYSFHGDCWMKLVYVKSSLGMLRREDCVPALCARWCLLAWALGCTAALCFVSSHRSAVMNA